MRRYGFLFGLTFLVFSISTAYADLLTGCLTPGGTLTKASEGEVPAKPCGPNETLIKLQVAGSEESGVCPCDIKSGVLLAGWREPTCKMHYSGGPIVSLAEAGGFGGPGPIIDVGYSRNLGNFCLMLNFASEFLYRETGLDDEQVEACKIDLDELAFKLGFVDGCDP